MKYKITIPPIIVEAENEEEAELKALEKLTEITIKDIEVLE